MNSRSSNSGQSDKAQISTLHLIKALPYVLERWIPVSSNSLQVLTDGLSSGRYENNRELLWNDISKDMGLFLYCIRKLSEITRIKVDPLLEWVNPCDLIENSSLELLQEAFSSHTLLISTHELSQALPAQGGCLVESLTAATVSKDIAHTEGVDPKLCYATALFRQLGLTLISWNYPHIFQRALTELSPEKSLDDLLNELLGFSPSLLGITIARSWCLSPETLVAMGDLDMKKRASEQSLKLAEKLTTICMVGEKLAQAAFPEKYPTAQGDWKSASEEIRRRLGPKGFDMLFEHIRQQLGTYLDTKLPHLSLPPLLAPELQHNIDAALETKSHRNRYISLCPEPTRGELFGLYQSTAPDQSLKRESLEYFIQSVIPRSGFLRGAIYLLDPDSMVLRPRIIVGSLERKNARTIPYSSYSLAHHPMVTAMKTTVPLEYESSLLTSQSGFSLVGALGISQKVGVLYLEAGDTISDSDDPIRMNLFKAFRQTLNDLLKLE